MNSRCSALLVCFAFGSFLPPAVWAHSLEVGDPEVGRLREVVFPSPSFGNVSLLVYTPPGYFSVGDSRRFPVIYWLHGSGSNHLQLENTLAALPVAGTSAAAKLDRLIAEDEIPPLMMVSVAAPGGLWDSSLLELITGEAIDFVDATYRTIATRSGRGIEGFSLGSQGLSIYATARPDLYASISLVAGAFLSANWTAAAPALLREGSEVYITVGDADAAYPQTASFDAQLTSLGIPHVFTVIPGVGHTNTGLYAAHGVEILRWHAARFARTSLLFAGNDVELETPVPTSLSLSGLLNDPAQELGPNPVLTWTLFGGPGPATIDSPSQLSTLVHLPALGTYHFRLEAQGAITVADIVRVQVFDLTAALSLRLPLDSGSGADASGNGRNATILGNVTTDPDGRFQEAMAFDGEGDALTVPDFTYGPGFSVALWLKSTDLAGNSYQYLFSHNGFDASPSCNLYLPETSAALTSPDSHEGALGSSARLRLAIRDSVGDLAGQAITAATPTLDAGEWHHAAVVVTPGSGSTLYFDGRRVATTANGGDSYNPSTAVHFAARSFTPVDRYFRGSLDEIRLYGRPLFAEEVALLAAPEIVNEAPTVAAGLDRLSYRGSPLLLAGLVADPTPTGQLTRSWSRVSGPGLATFADPAAAETSVTFSHPGTHLLRLTASDGQLAAQDDLIVTVVAESLPGLVAQWTFDDGSGATAADRSGLGHTGTLSGSPTFIGDARIGSGALRFTATAPAHVVVDASPVLDFDPAEDSFSVTAWLRLAPGEEGTIVARGSADAAARAIHFHVRDLDNNGRSDLVGIVGGLTNNNAQGLGPRFDDNAWHHVALVHDAVTDTQRLYLDGVALGSPAPSGSVTSTVDLLIGARRASANTGAAFGLDGDLDDVRLYSEALDPAEVSLIFTGPTIPPCGPPTCLFGDGFELGNTSAWVP